MHNGGRGYTSIVRSMSITDIPAEATEKATTTSSNSWLFIRDQLVQQATDDEDLELLRRLAALPGGFGSDVMRRRAWYVVSPSARMQAGLRVVQLWQSAEGHLAVFFFGITLEAARANADHCSGSSCFMQMKLTRLLRTPRKTPNPKMQMTPSWRSTEMKGRWGSTLLDHSSRIRPVRSLSNRTASIALVSIRALMWIIGIPRESKEALQADLHNLIVGVLGAHPRLSYFQVSLLLATFGSSGVHNGMELLPRVVPETKYRMTSKAS